MTDLPGAMVAYEDTRNVILDLERLYGQGSPSRPELQILSGLLNRNTRTTRESYARDLRLWAAWCQERRIPLLQAERTDIERWVRESIEGGTAKRTVNRRLASLSGYYKEALDLEYVRKDPTARVKRLKVDEDQALGLGRDECRKLLEVAAAKGPRDEALICLLMLNGLRASEVAALKVGDRAFERSHHVIRTTRKGDKRRTIPLAPRTAHALDRHLLERTPTGNGAATVVIDQDLPLVANDEGGQLSRHGVFRICRRLGRAAKLPIPLHPHELRHAFITQALDAGVSVRDAQAAADHSDPKTTIGYDRRRQSHENHATYAVARHLA